MTLICFNYSHLVISALMTLARTVTLSVVKNILEKHSNANTKYLEEISKSVSNITVVLGEHKFINYSLSQHRSVLFTSNMFTHFEDFEIECQTIKQYTVLKWNPSLLNLLIK